jgi:RNA polymerase sigma-70 factor, ECF subfamily
VVKTNEAPAQLSGLESGVLPEFATLVRQRQSMVFGIAWNYLNNRSLAEEVAQDVFVQLYEHWGEIASEAHAVNWLRRTALHRAIDSGRRRVPFLQLADLPDPAAPDARCDPLRKEYLRRLVASLPEEKRAIVILRFQEDLEVDEIAKLMRMPAGTVKSELRRALDLLRQKAIRVLGENAL